ncbi:unnamed protein product [Macrosiphum euphorbiae]|uniref:Zinc finger MYM-type protein 1-like n=1 Tax=Macrosiphum euphorbiae TaxID=13131 RepID=A0AAV0X0C1_9HEMI|nr:unnamed protein product [Macrosiphum euphorbiae]
MFEIFKFKSKTTEEISKEIPSNTTDQLEVVVDDSDLDLGDLESGPKRPTLKEFPLTQFGTQKRGFNSNYENNNWLEYSINKDAIFCYACRIFGNNHGQ